MCSLVSLNPPLGYDFGFEYWLEPPPFAPVLVFFRSLSSFGMTIQSTVPHEVDAEARKLTEGTLHLTVGDGGGRETLGTSTECSFRCLERDLLTANCSNRATKFAGPTVHAANKLLFMGVFRACVTARSYSGAERC
ncbi:hypothetical protein MKW98_021134 [Papaver atlanticum]|uniref:Uncharacterized protein n=1 Tax=Papaver atlanticum TaxID=357466 RepID=A0AAD4T739_9MAGN|nr:hypothetical protein MKW98_021134 [Papaver atlanticum]